MCRCALKALVTVTYSIFSPFLGNPPRLTANKLTTLTLEMMNSVSCEGLQYYWVTCDERDHRSTSKYNFPEILNCYNQFKCSKKNIEKGWELQFISKEQPCRWLLLRIYGLFLNCFCMYIYIHAQRHIDKCVCVCVWPQKQIMFVASCEWVTFVRPFCDWALSVCGRLKYVRKHEDKTSFCANTFTWTTFYLGSLVSESTPPELGGVCLGDAEVVALKETVGEDGL